MRELIIAIRRQTKINSGPGNEEYKVPNELVDFRETLEYKIYFGKNTSDTKNINGNRMSNIENSITKQDDDKLDKTNNDNNINNISQSIHSGWLRKYSRVKHTLRKRFVVLTNITRNGDKKIISTYKMEKDANDEKNATEIIEVNDVYNVMEYYGSLNKTNDNKHFIVNDKFVFQCDSPQQRELWISKIIKTIAYELVKDKNEKKTDLEYFCSHFDTFEQLQRAHQTSIEHKNDDNIATIPMVIGTSNAKSIADENILLTIFLSKCTLNFNTMKNFIKNVVDEIKHPLTGTIDISIKDKQGNCIDTSTNNTFYSNVIDKTIHEGYHLSVDALYKYCRTLLMIMK